MQVRTFALDRAVTEFAESGGRQLVLLGAGLDARALRLRHLGLRVFEVDHPATQRAKRPLTGDAATLVPCDFEHDPLRLLPARLAEAGYRPGERACVVWEGVSMYLSETAIEETFAMLRELLPGGSVLAFTYFSLERLRGMTWLDRSIRRYVARRGEPWRFGWDPRALPAWLSVRGFALEYDDTIATLAPRWLPGKFAALLRDDLRRIALASRRSGE
jgi:methyltransferase (TIGR00027 family)